MFDMPEKTFDWVRARGKCSPPEVFKELEQGAHGDVEAIQSLLHRESEMKFSVVMTGQRRFSVLRVQDPVTNFTESVNFVLEKT